MTLAQLQTAAPLLNVRALSRAVGKSDGYLSSTMAQGRELPEAVQAEIRRVLRPLVDGLQTEEAQDA